MSNPYSPEALRKRFWEVSREVDAIRAKSKPARDGRDALLAQQRPLVEQEKVLIAEYKAIEKDLPALDSERAMLARALGNKVGEPI